jgi:hypothetical protein
MNDQLMNTGLILLTVVLFVLWYRRRRARKLKQWK